jgi:retron-type reverse transcriptase
VASKKTGSGYRGGTWNNSNTNARVSDRNNAANANNNRNNNNGARCAKTSIKPGRAPANPAPAIRTMIENIFDTVIHRENLYRAAYAAAKGKRYNRSTADFNFSLEGEIDRLRHELKAGTYRHGAYKVFKIYEPKERNIAKAPFRDRVVHHAVHDVIEPIIDRSFIFDSYACRRGKGTHLALARARSFSLARRYCLHGDIRKYFPSIDRAVLKILLRRRISDPKLLRLLDEIIDSAASILPEKGLPIGNLTSQFFANLYLHELDRFAKHGLCCRYYIRYMDDFLLFDDDPARLGEWRCVIKRFLESRLKVEMHADKTQIYSMRKGFTFMGFRLSAGSGAGRSRVCAAGMRRMRARLKRFRYLAAKRLMTEAEMADSVLCWAAHSRYADASSLRRRLAAETSSWSASVPAALLA